MWWLVGVLLVVVLAVIIEIPRRRAVRPYYQRACAGIRWRRQFPGASAAEIGEFLRLFVDAFCFPRKHRLRFRPDDKIMDLYRAANPPDWSIGDNMELEGLVDDFQDRYHVDLTPLWREDLTLGEVFSYSRST
jgi:propanediol dehydratase small subunit